MKVKDIMKKIMAVDDVSLKQAAKIMAEKKVGSLVVMEDDKIEGIITERDVLKNVDRLQSKVSKIMTNKVITISQDASIDEAARLMRDNCIKRIPVMKGEVIMGIVTATDVIANSDALNENFLFDD